MSLWSKKIFLNPISKDGMNTVKKSLRNVDTFLTLSLRKYPREMKLGENVF